MGLVEAGLPAGTGAFDGGEHIGGAAESGRDLGTCGTGPAAADRHPRELGRPVALGEVRGVIRIEILGRRAPARGEAGLKRSKTVGTAKAGTFKNGDQQSPLRAASEESFGRARQL